MKHWRKTSGVRIGRVVSTFSLVCAGAVCLGGPYGDLDEQLAKTKTAAEKVNILSQASFDNDRELTLKISQASADQPSTVDDAVAYVNLKAIAERAGSPADQSGSIQKIKSSSLYRDDGKKESANWLQGAVNRLKNLAWKNRPRPNNDSNRNSLGDWGAFGQFLIYFVWFLLGAAVLAFIIYAIRFIGFGKLKHRRAKAMLEDDEPERTLDEWLALAESLEREGKFREAVRALYLACLLKFDERNIARFVRSQTNWEHLARIESSPRLPAGLDFRTPTQAFDRIWYGYKVRGPSDVDDFRAWYRQITGAFREAAV